MSGTRGALLVVDDNPENRDMLARRLRRRGYDVAEAENGLQALELAAGREFDVVLLDVMMPVMDGLETLRRLRQTRSVAELPVIMTTAKGESEDVVEALTLGANDYVTKPINLPVALARIETQLSLRRAVQEIRRLEADLAARNLDLEAANGRLSTSNARMKRDLEAAARIQQAFLPGPAPSVGTARFAWRYRPCDELAGDTLNVVPLDGRHVGVFVVDVSGHGVPAALLSVTVSRLLSADDRGLPPREARVERLVRPRGRLPGRGRLRAREPVPVRPRDQAVLHVRLRGPRLLHRRVPLRVRRPPRARPPAEGPAPRPPPARGASDRAPPRCARGGRLRRPSVTLAPGDRIYLFTDGIPEAANPSEEEFGFERLQEVLCASRADSLQSSVDTLVARVEAWCGRTGVADDVSVLAIEF